MNKKVDDLLRALSFLILEILRAYILSPLVDRMVDDQLVVFVREFFVVISNEMPPDTEEKAPSVKDLFQLKEYFPLFDQLH